MIVFINTCTVHVLPVAYMYMNCDILKIRLPPLPPLLKKHSQNKPLKFYSTLNIFNMLSDILILHVHTVKSHFKALGLYNFIRCFGWAYKWGGGDLYPGGLVSGIKNVSEQQDKTYLRN